MTERWKDERGETLVEVAASVLIMTLAVLLLYSAVMVSVRINENAKETDKKFYGALNAAEEQSTEASTDIAPTPEVTVKPVSPAGSEVKVEVSFYGEEGALSYKYQPTGP